MSWPSWPFIAGYMGAKAENKIETMCGGGEEEREGGREREGRE